MKPLFQATMSTTTDAAASERFSGNYRSASPESEVEAELQARLADTEARLSDALNRLAFREAELAAFAPDGAAPPRRAVLMARIAELEQSNEARESELQDLRSTAKARAAELGNVKTKLKALEKSAKARDTELSEAKAKLKALEKSAKARDTELSEAKAKLKTLEKSAKTKTKAPEKSTKTRDTAPSEAKTKPKPPEKSIKTRDTAPSEAKAHAKPLEMSTKPRDTEHGQGRTKPKALEVALEQVRSTQLWKIANKSMLAASRSLGIGSTWRKNTLEREALRRDIELLTSSELFDANWYLDAYPDVAKSGINPAQHYLRHGAAEGRDPGPRFSTRKYLTRHSDVARAGMNPLLHYLKFGLDERRAIFAAARSVPVVKAPEVGPPKRPTLEPEPALAAATVFSLPPVRREEAAWTPHEALSRREGRTTLELHGTILGWLPSSAQVLGTDSLASLPMVGAAALFCRMMRLADAKALACFEADAEFALSPADVRCAPLGRHLLFNADPIALADAWFASAHDLRLRLAKAAPVLRFFQWDRRAGKLVLLSEVLVRASNGLADIPTVNPLLPILISSSDGEGVLQGLFLLPFPSLCRGGSHHGELLAGEGGNLMERLLALSTSLMEKWLSSGQGAFTIGRIDVDLAEARGSELIFARAVQFWLDGCFDLRCHPINGAAITDERARLYLEERLRGEAHQGEELSERERSASYALQLSANAIPSLQALVARGALTARRAGLGTSVLVDGATGKPRWLLDLARLDARLLENSWVDGPPSPKVIPLREPMNDLDQSTASDAAHGFILALTACSDSAGRFERIKPDARPAESGRTSRNPSVQPEISVLCPYWGDEQHFAAFLDSLRLQTNVTKLEVIVTAESDSLRSEAARASLVRRYFDDSRVISCADRGLPGTRLNLMAERARGDLLLVATGVLLHDPSTLDTLRRIAGEERAATVGCVLRRVAAGGVASPAHLHCAGFHPAGAEEHDGVVAAFEQLTSPAPLGGWAYPIAANPPPLFMIRKTIWRELGGFNETLSEMAAVAIDFAVRATARQYVHFCTSALAATVVDEALAVTPEKVPLPSPTPPLSWRDVAARSITMRRLVT